MTEEKIIYRPIGIIHSEHQLAEETPIQPVYAEECHGEVEVFEPYAAGLSDLDGFSHVYLLYHFHRAREVKLRVKPFLQDVERGVFSIRAPCRPNAIGLSVVKLLKIAGRILHIAGVDIIDGTPLLDIKPYTAKFDFVCTTKNGWQDEVDEKTAQRRGKRNYSRKSPQKKDIK